MVVVKNFSNQKAQASTRPTTINQPASQLSGLLEKMGGLEWFTDQLNNLQHPLHKTYNQSTTQDTIYTSSHYGTN